MRLGSRVSSSKQSAILHFSPLSGFVVSTSGRKITHDGDKGELGGAVSIGHIALMGEQDVADVLGVERVGEALRARCFLAT